MEYGLVFTIYGIIFMILLLVTVRIKKIKDSVKNSLYLLLICTSIMLAFLEALSVVVLVYDDSLFKVFTLIWNFRNVALFMYLYTFILYYIELIKPSKYVKFREYFIKNKLVLFSFIILIIFSIIYVIMIVPNNYVNGMMIFFGGKSTSAFVIIGGFMAAGVIALTFKFRKSRKNLFQCITLIVVLMIIIFPFQMKFKTTSLIPFALMFILYIFYYNIENPDIDLLEEVMILKSDIDKSSNTKSDFLFNLSYDLVNPINTIVSLSDSVNNMQTLNREEIINDIKAIKLAGNILLDSIDNVLDMSDNSKDSSLKEYSLYEILSRMKSLCETRIGSKQVKFEMDIDNNLSSRYIGDVNKIQKVLMNVLGNAVKFTDVGKIRFTITSSIVNAKSVLHFKIFDTGRGIKDEEKSFIFSDNESDKSGVGLAISKKYIEEMGGSIRFESSFGAGTTFYIDLPQIVSGNRLISEDLVNVSDDKFGVGDFGSFKILIVDDDNLDVKVIKRLLEKYNFQIEVCNSTLEFIDMIKKEYTCDIVFLDHKMPDLDGVETVKVLRELEGYSLPKIISLTANASFNAHDYYKSVGFDDYIAKPVNIKDLDEIIKKYCRK